MPGANIALVVQHVAGARWQIPNAHDRFLQLFFCSTKRFEKKR